MHFNLDGNKTFLPVKHCFAGFTYPNYDNFTEHSMNVPRNYEVVPLTTLIKACLKLKMILESAHLHGHNVLKSILLDL